MAILGHNLSAGVRNYLKVTMEKKRNILNSVMQRLTGTMESDTTNNNDEQDKVQYFAFLLQYI
jgi:hypothetical protein